MSDPGDYPNPIHDFAEDLLECARAEVSLTDNGLTPKMRIGVVPGELAWDKCECDMLTVNLVSMYPSRQFPTPDPGLVPCGAPITVVQYRITIVRCVPTPSANGKPPTVDALAESARRFHQDIYAVWKGVTCCLLALRDDDFDFVVTSMTPIGPDGGCVSAAMDVSVSLNDLCICG